MLAQSCHPQTSIKDLSLSEAAFTPAQIEQKYLPQILLNQDINIDLNATLNVIFLLTIVSTLYCLFMD